jgi:hypothetical protein
MIDLSAFQQKLNALPPSVDPSLAADRSRGKTDALPTSEMGFFVLRLIHAPSFAFQLSSTPLALHKSYFTYMLYHTTSAAGCQAIFPFYINTPPFFPEKSIYLLAVARVSGLGSGFRFDSGSV